jgi:hypothetical protein
LPVAFNLAQSGTDRPTNFSAAAGEDMTGAIGDRGENPLADGAALLQGPHHPRGRREPDHPAICTLSVGIDADGDSETRLAALRREQIREMSPVGAEQVPGDRIGDARDHQLAQCRDAVCFGPVQDDEAPSEPGFDVAQLCRLDQRVSPHEQGVEAEGLDAGKPRLQFAVDALGDRARCGDQPIRRGLMECRHGPPDSKHGSADRRQKGREDDGGQVAVETAHSRFTCSPTLQPALDQRTRIPISHH